MQALTPLDIEAFYARLAEGGTTRKPLSAKTIRNTHVVLRKSLADAGRLGLVPRNAAATAKPPVAQRENRRAWSSEEVVARQVPPGKQSVRLSIDPRPASIRAGRAVVFGGGQGGSHDLLSALTNGRGSFGQHPNDVGKGSTQRDRTVAGEG